MWLIKIRESQKGRRHRKSNTERGEGSCQGEGEGNGLLV